MRRATSMRTGLFAVTFCLATLILPGAARAEAPVLATVTVGSGPVSIAVNQETNKVYVADVRSADVTVLDGASHSVITRIQIGSYPLRLAVDTDLNRVFVAD